VGTRWQALLITVTINLLALTGALILLGTWSGGLLVVRAAVEMDEQARALGIENAHVVLAAGSGGTLAGLMAELVLLLDSSLQLLGIDVGKLWKRFPASIARLASELRARLGQARTFNQAPMIEETYVGQAYAVPSEQRVTAIKRLARVEGILLDPVYTGKAFAGLLDLVERKQLGRDEPVIFLHTGGFGRCSRLMDCGKTPSVLAR
jgi:1-aminocyclopropane-1-carboxylate deaminase/D-cysteine desulfhydrase-like pyridoxal-dependent ACC family enzyme